eukprot:CAMPEP_0119016570 /NCGR_PEP_ID=MMETSP1176-20130426/13621_1 /TAXON_ID=265551 /ORGANISM="Synedropsis recta cf, Strain CCMP1620" /LENGTH=158 /DNA_ID=CAMNT_0006970039 /DNA_START=61 /DNA_END=534 /DNA_ORIENTATION=-
MKASLVCLVYITFVLSSSNAFVVRRSCVRASRHSQQLHVWKKRGDIRRTSYSSNNDSKIDAGDVWKDGVNRLGDAWNNGIPKIGYKVSDWEKSIGDSWNKGIPKILGDTVNKYSNDDKIDAGDVWNDGKSRLGDAWNNGIPKLGDTVNDWGKNIGDSW